MAIGNFYNRAYSINLNDLEGIINHDLALISRWAKQWLVTFNPSKTEAMLFSSSFSRNDVPKLILTKLL